MQQYYLLHIKYKWSHVGGRFQQGQGTHGNEDGKAVLANSVSLRGQGQRCARF